jgi:hypothetical protein
MSTMGRKDGFLSGVPYGNNERLNEVIAKAVQVAAIDVYCTKVESHVFKLGQLGKDEICIMCKREGVRSDVAVKQEIPKPVFRARYDEDDDEDESQRKDYDPTGMLSSGTGLPKKPVTGDSKLKKSESYETGGTLDGQPIRTAKSRPRSGTWTGSR